MEPFDASFLALQQNFKMEPLNATVFMLPSSSRQGSFPLKDSGRKILKSILFRQVCLYKPPYSGALREAICFAALRFPIVTPLYYFRRKEVFRQAKFYLAELYHQLALLLLYTPFLHLVLDKPALTVSAATYSDSGVIL